jgi:hypothetical protein
MARIVTALVAFALVAFVCAMPAVATVVKPGQGESQDQTPTGKGWGSGPSVDSTETRARSNGMIYHGGPIILGTTHVYYIYYGTWSAGAQSILNDLAATIGGSPYFNINTTYYNGSNVPVTNAVTFGGSTADNNSQGKSLSDTAVRTIVSNAITGGALPKDTNGVYFVLTATDVAETSGFCSFYCGWHTHATISGSDIKYAFVGNPDRCKSACEEQTSVSPNGDTGADGAASIVSHELEEAVTDPDLNAWYDRNGAENADKCAWTFGTEYTVANGSKANMHLGSRDFLIQRNWKNTTTGAGCAQSY